MTSRKNGLVMRDTKKLIEMSQKILAEPRLLAAFIDHTLLKPEASARDIQKLCEEALQFSFKAVCVNSNRVALAKTFLDQSSVLIASVVGFPLGAHSPAVKALEAERASHQGASEIDMVIDIGHLKDKNYIEVARDISEVVHAAASCRIKVILETGLLTTDEIRTACQISEESGAHFVKTSTGFLGRGASLEDLQIMSERISEHIEIKASGGIRDLKSACQMIRAGATRIGVSSGVQIIQSQISTSQY
jgi:deoxyribose-phosphate aldolase